MVFIFILICVCQKIEFGMFLVKVFEIGNFFLLFMSISSRNPRYFPFYVYSNTVANCIESNEFFERYLFKSGSSKKNTNIYFNLEILNY